MKNIALCTALVLLFAAVAVGEEGYYSPCYSPYSQTPATVPSGNIKGQFVVTQLVICEFPVEENGKLLAETLADQVKAMTVPVNGTLGEVRMIDAIEQLEKEGKLTVLSRPQITTLDNQMASLIVGSRDPKNGQQHGLLTEITPRIEGGRILTKIQYKYGNNLSELDYISTDVSLQDGIPFFVGGAVKENPDHAKKEISFCITAMRVDR